MQHNKPKLTKIPTFNTDKDLADSLLSNLNEALKQSIRVTVKIMIRQEMEAFRQEVEDKLSFNGFYQRNMTSLAGKIDNIEVPRFREKPMGDLSLQSLNIFNQEKDKFCQLVAEMHRLGISQRKISKLCKIVFGIKISANRAGLVHQELAKQEEFQINSQKMVCCRRAIGPQFAA